MEQKPTVEQAFRYCIDEHGKSNVIRVEVQGIAKVACWLFVIGSIAGFLFALLDLAMHN